MGWIDDVYDKIPKPVRCCENCANGTMHVTDYGDEWRDVYRCRLDNVLKDYRIHCDNYQASGERGGGAGSPQPPRAPRSSGG